MNKYMFEKVRELFAQYGVELIWIEPQQRSALNITLKYQGKQFTVISKHSSSGYDIIDGKGEVVCSIDDLDDACWVRYAIKCL